jgi:hypothetical protein
MSLKAHLNMHQKAQNITSFLLLFQAAAAYLQQLSTRDMKIMDRTDEATALIAGRKTKIQIK